MLLLSPFCGAGRLLVVLVIFCALKTGLGAILDVDTTADVYGVLNSSQVPVFVMLYMHGCRYCEELEPHFSYLQTLFPEKLALLKVDGKRASGFAREIGVRSFPELVLFGPGEDSYLGKFHDSRDLVSLASFVSRNTGLMAEWQHESQICTLDDASAPIDLSQTNLLVFVSPWMDPELVWLFAGEQSTSVLNKLNSDEHEGVQVYQIDAASSSTAAWTRQFRVQILPTLIFLVPGPSQGLFELRIEWRGGCTRLNGQAHEILTQIIRKCGDSNTIRSCGCREYLETLPNVSIREISEVSVLRTLEDSNITEFDPNLAKEVSFENLTTLEDDYDDYEDDYDLEEQDTSIFDTLREL
ncbi:LAFA_0A06700g1_1 [Lachancea sp. 'fantastica']|nr:LAFA_0A06700g1_1 [Lachancea sp. 'fantastica']